MPAMSLRRARFAQLVDAANGQSTDWLRRLFAGVPYAGQSPTSWTLTRAAVRHVLRMRGAFNVEN